jgi:hypothetical protein
MGLPEKSVLPGVGRFWARVYTIFPHTKPVLEAEDIFVHFVHFSLDEIFISPISDFESADGLHSLQFTVVWQY